MEAPDYLKDEPNWNLWCGTDYKPGESGMITLRDTYSRSTFECMERNERKIEKDDTFSVLVEYMTPEVIRRIAITNFLETVYEKRGKRPPSHYRRSETPYRDRLLRHKPPVILVIMGVPNPGTKNGGNEYNSWAVDVAKGLKPQPLTIPGPHPLHARSREFAERQFSADVNKFKACLKGN